MYSSLRFFPVLKSCVSLRWAGLIICPYVIGLPVFFFLNISDIIQKDISMKISKLAMAVDIEILPDNAEFMYDMYTSMFFYPSFSNTKCHSEILVGHG